MRKAIIVLSGGQDSTTCLFHALNGGYDVHCVTFDYGQRHAIELNAARKVAALAGVPRAKHEFISLPAGVLASTSPLVSEEKLEQYKDHNSLPGGLEKTFVPMRNQLFLTIAANRAFALGTNVLFTGVCEEDSGGYPDCTEEFIQDLEVTCTSGTFTSEAGFKDGLNIITPLMHLSKAESVKLAMRLPGCYRALAYSHTAYDGAYPPVGKDHATLLRQKGFVEAGIPDPLILRAFKEGLMDLPNLDIYKGDLGQYWALLG